MLVIIDGYNVIKSGILPGLARGTLEQQRRELLSLIKLHRPQGSPRNRVAVVFDGPSSVPFVTGGPARSHDGEIEVLFSEGVSADERIEEMAQALPRGTECVIVSNDRGLRRLLGGSGVRWMSVAEFAGKLSSSGKIREIPDPAGDLDENVSYDINEELKKKWMK